MKYVIVLVFCICVAESQAQTFSCPRWTEDMLNYFVMGYPARVDQSMGPGSANPVYTTDSSESAFSNVLNGSY